MVWVGGLKNCVVDGEVNGRVNGWFTEAPEEATRRLNGGAAAGRAAAEVGARALPDAPPSRRGWMAVGDSDDWLCARFTIGWWVGWRMLDLNWR